MAMKKSDLSKKAKARTKSAGAKFVVKAAPSSRADMQRFLDSVPAMLGYWDAELRNVYSNKEYARYFMKSPAEIEGHHIKELLGPELYRKNLKYLKAALAGKPQTFEREITSPLGVTRQTLANYVPDRIKNRVVGVFVIVTDISSVKKLEARTREIEARLIASTKMSSLGEMAAGIAHEINNPLAIVYANACQASRALERGKVDHAKLRSLLKEIEVTSMRIEAIVDGLRVFSRDGGSNEPLQTVSAPGILEQTLVLCAARFKNHGVEVKTPKVRKDISLSCRPVPISQVILNLLNNAFDAVVGTANPIIEVQIIEEKNHVKFIFENSGKKIPPLIADKIFEPFFTTKPQGEGTGLGLSISKGIAESHKGTLSLDSSSKHTRFILRLPKHHGG